jgi:hypothetical protein
VSASSAASAIISGEDTYETLLWDSEQGEYTGYLPSPASSTSANGSASIGAASSSISATKSFPSAGTDNQPGPVSKALIQREVTYDSNEYADVEIPFSLSVDAAIDTPSTYSYENPIRPADARPSGYAEVNFTQDNRSVWIESFTIETSYWKSSLQKAVHERNADKSIHTDSVVQWNSTAQNWQAANNFQGLTPGFSNPHYKWDWSGAGQFTSGYQVPSIQPYEHMIMGLNFGNSETGFPKTGTLDLEVTDGAGTDRLIAKNNFGITFHLPYEKDTDLPNGPNTITKLRPLTKKIKPGYGEIVVSDAESFDLEAVIDGASVLIGPYGAALEEVIKFFKAITELTELTHNYMGNKGVDGNYLNANNYPFLWGPTVTHHPENIYGATPAELAKTDGNENFHMQMFLTKRWHSKHWLADKYTVNGFQSSGHHFDAIKITSLEPEPFYTRMPTGA